jgi:hypothetical protein
MAVTFVHSEIMPGGDLDSSGALEIRRQLIFTSEPADTAVAVMNHSAFPLYHATLAEDASFTCQSASLSRQATTPRPTWKVEAVYRTPALRNRGTESRGVRPWKLPIQDFKVSWESREIAFEMAYDNDNRATLPVVNRAGQPIETTTGDYYKRLSFYYYREKRPTTVYRTPIVNKNRFTIMDEPQIDPGQALLQPISFEKLTTADAAGKTLYTYYRVNVEMLVRKDGWQRKFLNVGTRARFTIGDSSYISGVYTWHHPDTGVQHFGSRYEEMQAYRDWNSANPAANTRDKWAVEQVTEPVPLTSGGAIDQAAIYNPADNPCRVLTANEYREYSFSFLNLP